jgi:hypothetical protein
MHLLEMQKPNLIFLEIIWLGTDTFRVVEDIEKVY